MDPPDILDLRRLFYRANYSQRDIAARLHVSDATVSYWWNGKRRPSEQHRLALAALVETVKTPDERAHDARVAQMAAIFRKALPR